MLNSTARLISYLNITSDWWIITNDEAELNIKKTRNDNDIIPNINVVYDIGAHKGYFKRFCEKIIPNVVVHQFEANPNKIKSGIWHQVALSHTDNAEVTFYCNGGTGDSYYIETDEFKKSEYESIILKTKRLDTYVKENNLPLPDFIKIDVQGAELDILKGCDEIINHCKLIHCEVPAKGVEFNKGAPNQKSYFDFFDLHGFKFKTKIKDHKANDVLIQHDYIFSKK